MVLEALAVPPTPSLAESSRQLSVTVKDDNDNNRNSNVAKTTHIYTLRGLLAGEIETWAAFCASVFAYKENPPLASYFLRHYTNDPQRNASYIRVAVYHNDNNDHTIVSSVRIFVRTASNGQGNDNGGTIRAAGIGEVCTSDAHRRRGLSKELLKDALNIIQEAGFETSMLHAAPEFFPFYKSAGYSCTSTTTKWTVVDVHRTKLATTAFTAANAGAAAVVVRPAIFPADTKQLMHLHHHYSETQFAGCIVRSEQYWNEYLSQELGESLLVLEEDSKRIISWLSIRHRGDRIQIREFGLDTVNSSRGDSGIGGYEALACLLQEAMTRLTTAATATATADTSALQETFQLLIPTVVLDPIRASIIVVVYDDESTLVSSSSSSYLEWDSCVAEDDHGWMYKSFINGKGINGDDSNSFLQPHLIWPSDSF